jgi:hypothetical protein
MGLDIRLLIGLLFSILGLILAGFGAVSDHGIYERSISLNLNLAWGTVLLVFAVVIVVLGNRRSAIRLRARPRCDGPTHTADGGNDS